MTSKSCLSQNLTYGHDGANAALQLAVQLSLCVLVQRPSRLRYKGFIGLTFHRCDRGRQLGVQPSALCGFVQRAGRLGQGYSVWVIGVLLGFSLSAKMYC